MEQKKLELAEQGAKNRHALFDRIIDKLAAQLRQHGAQFIIKKHSGELLVEGDVRPPEPEKKKRTITVPKGYYLRMFKDVVDCMIPGDEYEFTMEEGVDPEAFRSSVCGYCTETWGKAAYTSKVDRAANTVRLRYFGEGETLREWRS